MQKENWPHDFLGALPLDLFLPNEYLKKICFPAIYTDRLLTQRYSVWVMLSNGVSESYFDLLCALSVGPDREL